MQTVPGAPERGAGDNLFSLSLLAFYPESTEGIAGTQ